MDVYVTRQFMIFFYSKFGGQKTCELILENMQLIFKNTGDDPYLLHIHISSAFQESTLLQNIEKKILNYITVQELSFYFKKLKETSNWVRIFHVHPQWCDN